MSTAAAEELRRLADAIEAHKAAAEEPVDLAARELAAAEVLRVIGSATELGSDLSALRAAAAHDLRGSGWTATRIAELAGVTRSAISQLLTGRQDPNT